MQYNNNIYKTIIVAQSLIILSSLSVSSLAVAFDHASLIYFWYLSLSGIILIIITPITIAITRIFMRSLDSLNAIVSKPRCVRG
jgi:hypothetical protein